MKVKTNLIAGGAIADTTQTACDLCTKATGPIGEAEQQADQVVKGVVAGTTTFFDCLRKTLA